MRDTFTCSNVQKLVEEADEMDDYGTFGIALPIPEAALHHTELGKSTAAKDVQAWLAAPEAAAF